jgi:glycosyltransferase involved in cell wall biosynthesis
VTRLTVGMATYNDFDGVYFTLQSLRLYHDMRDVELLVVDNFGCDHTKSLVEDWGGGRYLRRTDVQGTAAPRDLVFREASGEMVVCCDSHVLFLPGVVGRLKEFSLQHPDCDDLLQGPLLYDDLRSISTHLEPEWREEFWGIWATDPRGVDPDSEPFEIPMQGLGAFACRKRAWLGFNARFRGFGGEEGYIHEKFRQAGRRTLCLPWFRWLHRFARPAGVPYRLTVDDKFRNYMIGHAELGLDLAKPITHFSARLPQDRIAAIAAEAVWGLSVDELSAPIASDGGGRIEAAAPCATPSSVRAVDRAEAERRRALVCFVGDRPHLIQQALALRHSWLHSASPDTDLVMMGPDDVLARFPHDVVKIPQRSVQDDAEWRGYRYIDSVACFNGRGAEQLERYSHVLRTDVDTFITPAWNDFHPAGFMFGNGGYGNDDDVRQRIRDIAAEWGFDHRGLTNVNSTWYGPTALVRRACAITEMLTKHILARYFANESGEWPGWYREVALLYAGEIAVNHCAPDAERTALLDGSNTGSMPTRSFAHIHCWHTEQKFSKHAFRGGQYTLEDARGADLDVASDYCLAMSFRSLGDLDAPVGPIIRSAIEQRGV